MVEKNSITLVGGKLIDGTGRYPLEESVVEIKGVSIEDVRGKGDIGMPSDSKIIDISGMTVIPGMIDLHVHLVYGDEPLVPGGAEGIPRGLDRSLAMAGIKSFANARSSLEMGFTTLRDVGDFGFSFATVALRNAIAQKMVEGPRILSSGQGISATGGHTDLLPIWLNRTDEVSCVADGVAEILKAVRRQVKMNVDWVKFMASGGVLQISDEQEFTDDEMAALVNEAHSKKKLVCAHALRSRGILAAIRAGVDSLEHGTYLTEEAVDLMIEKGIYLIPTLYVVYESVVKGAEVGVPDIYIKAGQPVAEAHFASFRMAWQAGVKIAMGTDAGYGPARHGKNAIELELMVKNGMSEMDAIIATTKKAAEAIRMGEKLGTIERGKLADLVVVDGNPLEDIKVLQDKKKIVLVMKEGTIYVNRMAC